MRQKNMKFVMLLLVNGTGKYSILKNGIVLQLETQDRKKRRKERAKRICEE